MYYNFVRNLVSALTGISVFAMLVAPVSALSFSYNSRLNTPAPEPELVVDMNMALHLMTTSRDNQIDLDWEALSGTGLKFDFYNVLYREGSFESFGGDSVSNAYVSTTSYSLLSLEAGNWWSFQVVPVKWHNNQYVEVASRSNMVKVMVTGEEEIDLNLSRPIVTKTIHDKVLTNFPRKADLDWRSVGNADYYQISLQCRNCVTNNNGWDRAVIYVSNENRFTTPALAEDGEYRFRIRAVSADGELSSWSRFRNFSYDTGDYRDFNPKPVELMVVDFLHIFKNFGWSKYDGDFTGYAVFFAEGTLAESDLLKVKPEYFGKSRRNYKTSDLEDSTSYSLEVVPFVRTGVSRTFIYEDASNVLYFTTGED